MFREISKLLVAYSSRILTLTNIPKEQMYSMKLKGVAICFNMLKAALCGNYVNFGVIRLYGDRALDDALEIFVKTLVSIPQEEILVCQDSQFTLVAVLILHGELLSHMIILHVYESKQKHSYRRI